MDDTTSVEKTHHELIHLETESTSNVELSTNDDGKDSTPSSKYAYLYKANYTSESQEKRREILLRMQKLNRNKTFDEKRGISECVESEQDNDFMEHGSTSEGTPYARHFRNAHKYTKVKGMFSEWLTEVPNDLESEWFIKLCPIGVRNLVVATNFRTRAYKYGKLVSEFQSELPAGRPYSGEKDSVTVLDCIYNQNLKCIFVLDVLLWKDCNLCKSPASLRFFWLKSRLSEIPVQEITDTNEYRFIEVPEFPAQLSTIEEKLAQPYRQMDEILPLDGILFYHKETWYISGRTPLVGWLKPYMIPEKLHIPVCEYFMQKIPSNYVSLEHLLSTKTKNDVVMQDDSKESEEKMQ